MAQQLRTDYLQTEANVATGASALVRHYLVDLILMVFVNVFGIYQGSTWANPDVK